MRVGPVENQGSNAIISRSRVGNITHVRLPTTVVTIAAIAATVTIAGRAAVPNCDRKIASRDAFPAT